LVNPQEYLKNNPFFTRDDEPEVIRNKREVDNKIYDEQIEMERLCYEIFHVSENGKELWKILYKQFISRSLFQLAKKDPNFFTMHPEIMSFYWEAFKDALRGLHNNGEHHKQRMAGVNGY
jgi:hypothetical protein